VAGRGASGFESPGVKTKLATFNAAAPPPAAGPDAFDGLNSPEARHASMLNPPLTLLPWEADGDTFTIRVLGALASLPPEWAAVNAGGVHENTMLSVPHTDA